MFIGVSNMNFFKFSKDEEAQYNIETYKTDLVYIRIMFLVGTLFYLLFTILDFQLNIPDPWLFFRIRVFIVCPIFMISFILSFHKSFYKYHQFLTTTSYIIAGLGIIAMLVIIPLNHSYYSGLFLIFAAGHFLTRTRLKYLTIGSLIILICYLFVSIFYLSSQNPDANMYFVFYAGVTILNIYASFTHDKYKRDKFKQVYILHDDKVILEKENYEKLTLIRKAEDTIYKSEKRYKSIFNQAALGILSTTISGNIINANSKCCDILEDSIENLEKTNIYNLIHRDDKKQFSNLLSKLIKQNIEVTKISLKLTTTKNNTSHVNMSLSAVKDINSVTAYIIYTLEDITDIKILEEKNRNIAVKLRNQQKLESMGILAGGVAHEINNPITGILGYSQLIIDEKINHNDINLYASEIKHETERVAKIVKSLLQFSRQEIEDYHFTNIEDIIGQTISLINTIVNHDQIDLQVNIQPNTPDIYCISHQIQQVIMNLITNARDALNSKYESFDKDKKIILNCGEIKKNGKYYMQITIKDFGDGIPESVQSKIFDPFFTTKERDKGTGLGLAISYGIIKDHAGELTFESKQGQYTIFYLNLPVGR